MTNSKITSLTELNTTPADNDMLIIVDVSDTTMNATGTNKKIAADMFIRTNGTASTLANNIDANTKNITNVGQLACSSSSFPPFKAERTATSGSAVASAFQLLATTSSNMVDGFGGQLVLSLQDNAAVVNNSAAIRWDRDGADGQALVYILTGGISSAAITARASGNVGIGNTSPAYLLDVNGQCHASSFPTSSDIRLKENITPLSSKGKVIPKLMNINSYEFDWKDDYTAVDQFKRNPEGRKDKQIGFIAQEVKTQFPEVVTEWRHSKKIGLETEENVLEDALAVDYTRMVPILLEAIKELYSEIQSIKVKIK